VLRPRVDAGPHPRWRHPNERHAGVSRACRLPVQARGRTGRDMPGRRASYPRLAIMGSQGIETSACLSRTVILYWAVCNWSFLSWITAVEVAWPLETQESWSWRSPVNETSPIA